MSASPVTDTYLARQPVFDRSLNVYGYELFFRSGAENAFSSPDGDKASSQVIESSLNTFGLGRLTVGRRVFINVTKPMITQGIVSLLPPRITVLELVPSVPPDPDVVAVCRALKKQGFQIALDGFTLARAETPLTELADILKVDFQSVPAEERTAIVKRHSRPGVTLLGMRLGLRKELTQAMEMGYALYQGFFFCRPEMIARKDPPAYKVSYLRFLREVNRPDADFETLDSIIREDVTLSLKLLRYINSAMMGLRSRVESIRQALTLLGLVQVRRWASLLALAAMCEDKPSELVVTSLIRARFCEQLGMTSGLKNKTFDLFMIGMFSVIDAILDRPMIEVLSDLSLADEVKGALMGKPEGLGRVLGLTLAYEHAEWDRLPALLERLEIDPMALPGIYREAVAWAGQIFQAAGA